MWVSVFQTQVLHPGPQVYTWQSALGSPGKGHFTSVPSLVSRSTLLLLSGLLSAATSFSGNSSTVTGPSDKLSYFWVSVNCMNPLQCLSQLKLPTFFKEQVEWFIIHSLDTPPIDLGAAAALDFSKFQKASKGFVLFPSKLSCVVTVYF